MNELLTPKEVAKIFKLNYRKILEMTALGELSASFASRDGFTSSHWLLYYWQEYLLEVAVMNLCSLIFMLTVN
ncbi:MAG: hypothetical protein V3U24_04185 [Candidatus Neomarinimicrobiota bacterium]